MVRTDRIDIEVRSGSEDREFRFSVEPVAHGEGEGIAYYRFAMEGEVSFFYREGMNLG
ncbi:hypothetical protein J4772_20570 [Cohnella sp. LGH]|uniref:hypothetical protein n=1 Tax=Cohnella sp. LGH TaxID=1619153 RepID=UPI001ADBEC20|nr:hypothetical protein [Cohnella sp. LGH]QTH40018.1 hypothetical protein J4772_20570 [Cohnella sp. LGH]